MSVHTSLQFEQFLTEISDVVLGSFQAFLQPLLTSTRYSNIVVINSFSFSKIRCAQPLALYKNSEALIYWYRNKMLILASRILQL